MVSPLLRSLTSLALVLLVCGPVSVDSRLVRPSDVTLQALRHLSSDSLETEINGFFHSSGFPTAGRSLQTKIRDAEEFLAREIPKSGIVGTGVAVVYKDEVVVANGYGLRTVKDSSSSVSTESMFQIGSVTKTMVAVAIGLLVEDNKLKWKDPVKKHLPWLQLYDKYAEKFLTIGDLLAMNSGFGGLPDLANFLGKFPTERDYVEALKDCEPQHSLREKPEYANVNYAILGQLIETVSGMPWYTFMRERLWKPLGMENTFASAEQVPESRRHAILNDGHFACEGEVLGPYDVVSAFEMQLSPGRIGGYDAAGSVVSSAADMATFLRLILNKGRVGNVTLLHSPTTIGEMVTGKALASGEVLSLFNRMGLHYEPDGAALTAGYGFDIVGQVLWGHAYFDKSGDVAAHQTRTGFAPHHQLAVIFMGNTQVPDPHASFYLDHYRSYVLGIFLDVPKPILDREFQRWRTADQLVSPLPGIPRCGLRFWKNPPSLPIPDGEAQALQGSYMATTSADFFATVTISQAPSGLRIKAVAYEGALSLVVSQGSARVFLVQGTTILFAATRSADGGAFTLNIGVDYIKKTITASA